MDDINKIKTARELIDQFAELFKGINIEIKKTIKLYLYVIRKLPGVVMIDKDFIHRDCFLQGIISLYSKEESRILTEESKNEKRISFRFMKNNEAIINLGLYTDQEIFKGSWSGALFFILEKIEKSSIFPILNKGKRNSIKKLAKVLGADISKICWIKRRLKLFIK